MAECEVEILKKVQVERVVDENEEKKDEGKNKKRPYKRKLQKGQTTLTSLVKKK